MFGKRLKKCLIFRKVRPIDLAKGCHISKSGVSQYISGYRTPKRQTIEKFASFLKVNPLYLMGMSNEMIATNIEIKPDEELDGTAQVRQALTNELINIASRCEVDNLRQLIKLARTFVDE